MSNKTNMSAIMNAMAPSTKARHNRLLGVGYEVRYPGLSLHPDGFTYWLEGWQKPSAIELRKSGHTLNTYPVEVDWSNQISFPSLWVASITDEQFDKLLAASKSGFRYEGPLGVIKGA